MAERFWVFGVVLVIIVTVIVKALISADMYAKYEQHCQMTCLEQDVDKLRADFWDWRFVRYQICSQLLNYSDCVEPYVITIDNAAETYLLSVQKSDSTTEHYKIKSLVPENFDKLRRLKSGDLFRTIFVDVRQRQISDESFFTDTTFHCIIEHRHTRFLYYDILNFKIRHDRDIILLDISSNSFLPEKYVHNFLALLNIEMHYQTNGNDRWIANITDKIDVVSIGTNIFDQRNIILVEGNKLYSWCSTIGSIWFYFVILYFVTKMFIALHGFTKTFCLNIKYRERIELTRPDLIQVYSGDLNIFTSYFFSILFGKQGFLRAIFFTISFAVWFFSVTAYFDLIPDFNVVSKGKFMCILIICSVSFLFLFPFALVFLICFSLIFFTPELLVNLNSLGFIKIYHYYVIVILLFICATLNILFYNKVLMKDLLFQGDLVHKLLWPTWPVQLTDYLTKKYCRETNVNNIRIIILSCLCYRSLTFLQVPNDDSLVDSIKSYEAKYLLTMAYCLFFPVSYFLICFCGSYKRVISLVIEATFTALFVAYLMNFFLPWLYPSLKSIDPKENQYLYMVLILHLIIYLLKIYRDWYISYDRFLTDVISHVRDKYKCAQNSANLSTDDDCIAFIHNHIDDDDESGVCQQSDLKLIKGEITNDRFEIKGLMLITKGSNVYVPSDFFFEVIKLQGAPGPIKRVLMKELGTLVCLRLFPALFIYWLCNVMYLIDFEKYDTVIKVVIGNAFIAQYKELFCYRKISVVDVESNIAFQRRLKIFLDDYKSWFFVCKRK